MFERSRGYKHRDADHVDHEQRHTLQVDDEDFAAEGRDHEEKRAQKKYLDDGDREKRLQISPEIVWSDASMVGPGSEGSKESADECARESKDSGNKGAGPTPAQIGEFRNRLGEQNLVSVALEVAQNRGAEDGRDHDDAEEPDLDVIERIRVGRVEENFAVAVAERAEAFRRNQQERKREPQ